MEIITLTTERKREHAKNYIDNLPLNEFKLTIEPITYDRSLAQNSLSHMHYKQIGDQIGETPKETKIRIKLDFGVPILQATDQEFCDDWFSLNLFNDRARELLAAKLMQITSRMNTKQMAEYITAYMRQHESEGIALSHPDDLFNMAMGGK